MTYPFRVVRVPDQGDASERATDERRVAERYPAESKQLRLRTTRIATVTDESFEGYGLLVDDASDLADGQLIELQDGSDAVPVEGTITHLTRTRNGQWKVGVKLDESHLPI